MHTLIIGGNGLIGSSIVQSLEIKKNIIVCDLKKKIIKITFMT